jgi:hypothetical protein
LKRFWIIAGALAASLGTLAVALWLGAIGLEVHHQVEHESRLKRVMVKQPTADLLTKALAAEGSPLLLTAASAEDKERAAVVRGGLRLVEIREKAARHPELRVYQAGDMIYFIYFDQGGLMRDFTCVSR